MTTQQREIESQRKKEPQIPGQSNTLDCKTFRKYQLNKIQIGYAEYTLLTYNFRDLTKNTCTRLSQTLWKNKVHTYLPNNALYF